MNKISTRERLPYYDHFMMQEIPGFKQTRNFWNVELNSVKKELLRLMKELEKVPGLKPGDSVEEKAVTLYYKLRDFSHDLSEARNCLSAKVNSLLTMGEERDERLKDEKFRRDFRKSWNEQLLKINALVTSVEPVKKDCEVFCEAISFIFDNYSRKWIPKRVNETLSRPFNLVFDPIKRLVSRLELSN